MLTATKSVSESMRGIIFGIMILAFFALVAGMHTVLRHLYSVAPLFSVCIVGGIFILIVVGIAHKIASYIVE